jgi:hypothetical protein
VNSSNMPVNEGSSKPGPSRGASPFRSAEAN